MNSRGRFVVAAAAGLCLLTTGAAVAADAPRAPALCTPAQERAADGDDAAVAACAAKRVRSAQARLDGAPLDRDEDVLSRFWYRDDPADASADQQERAARPEGGEYLSVATHADSVTCRIAAGAGGELCFDASRCARSVYERFCQELAGGKPGPRDDSELPADLRKAKSTAAAAAAAGRELTTPMRPQDADIGDETVSATTETSLVERRIAANEAEAEAAAAARALGWIE